MKYKIEQGSEWNKHQTVYDESGKATLMVETKFYSLHERLFVRNAAGFTVAEISLRSTMTWGDHQIALPSRAMYTIRKCSRRACEHALEVLQRGERVLECQTDARGGDFTVRRRNEVVATISRSLTADGGTCGVDIGGNEDPTLILCCAMVIERICARDEADGE